MANTIDFSSNDSLFGPHSRHLLRNPYRAVQNLGPRSNIIGKDMGLILGAAGLYQLGTQLYSWLNAGAKAYTLYNTVKQAVGEENVPNFEGISPQKQTVKALRLATELLTPILSPDIAASLNTIAEIVDTGKYDKFSDVIIKIATDGIKMMLNTHPVDGELIYTPSTEDLRYNQLHYLQRNKSVPNSNTPGMTGFEYKPMSFNDILRRTAPDTWLNPDLAAMVR